MTPESLELEARDRVPNHPGKPALIWRGALQGDDLAAEAERLFARNGWPPAWRDGIFDYQHYHSNTHEVLGIAQGSARVALGGPGGPEVLLEAGDVVALAAGTGHCRVQATPDFLVVGAYPQGFSPDLWTQAPDDAARARIAGVPVPETDPVEGAGGALPRMWGG
jgi:uncharacterized protein YjlB